MYIKDFVFQNLPSWVMGGGLSWFRPESSGTAFQMVQMDVKDVISNN